MPSSGCKTCALRSEEHTSELQSHDNLVWRLLLEKNRRGEEAMGRWGGGRGVGCCGGGLGARVARSSDPLPATPGPPHARSSVSFFFFNDTATTEIYTLSLHDALPI